MSAPSSRSTGTAATVDGFDAPASFRHPEDAIGPRAQRTINRVVDVAREAFLARGYAGTTIDEIARIANVPRASFDTYLRRSERSCARSAHAGT